ncbi:hypothetical protein DTO271G3_1974 [Paecilomyces variotii]|nr:hypothetical protein DTO271G3_1974 [Paecilomyces variotii]
MAGICSQLMVVIGVFWCGWRIIFRQLNFRLSKAARGPDVLHIAKQSGLSCGVSQVIDSKVGNILNLVFVLRFLCQKHSSSKRILLPRFCEQDALVSNPCRRPWIGETHPRLVWSDHSFA